MKKLLSIFTCAVVAALTAVCFTACNPQTEPDKVNLVGLESAAAVIANDDIDYFVVPEPAASLRVKVTAADPAQKLNLVGDLQELYGGTKGYPQAVVVAKNSLYESNALNGFIAALNANVQWLSAETTQISTILNAVSGHITPGMEMSLNAKNLTKQVIANCGIRFEGANSCKEEVKSFLTALKQVTPTENYNPADTFFWGGTLPQTAGALDGVSVYAPDGAPALALAGLMAGEIDTSTVAASIDYHIVNANTIQTYVTGESPAADICILPVNAAAKLLGTGAKYTMLGTVTHGNLYVLSAKTSEKLTVENISSLRGKTVGVVNLAQVPGLTLKLILNKYGIEFAENS